jgi:hypothetical protein
MTATTVQQAHKNAELLLLIMDSLSEILSATIDNGIDGTHSRIVDAYDYAQREYRQNIAIAGRLLSAEKLKELRMQFIVNESDSFVDNLNFYGNTAIFTRSGNNWRMDFSPNGIEKLSLNVL